MSKTESSSPNYSALVRAVEEIPTPPEWLEAGKPIYSTKYGLGEVVVILGKRIIARFEKSEQTVSINNWVLAVESKQIVRAADAPLFDNSSSAINLENISNPTFQEVAIELEESLTHAEVIAAAEGELYPLPDNLPGALQTALSRLGINQIYSHQLESLTALREGRDISVVTATASGKTLCFNLAVLESCLTSQATALYLYPLKALAADQIGKLQSLVSSMPAGERVKVGLMTGDTSLEERQRLFDPTPPQVLGMSPDLLHFKLYSVRTSDGEPFREFLRRLRWVVVDESHTYVGSFGAHFTNLMRRLRLAVDKCGGDSDKVQFICSSATVGNPAEMALRFSGRVPTPERLHLIEKSGARHAERTFLCLKPSSQANVDAARIVLSLLHKKLRGICFCNSRYAVKSLLSLIKQEARRQGCSHLAEGVATFYGSLKHDRRNDIIQQLKSGRVQCILSTSALEAGMDLPGLDWCLVRGYPGSLMSFRQRVGRAGRGQKPGFVIFLPIGQTHLDSYYSCNPDLLLHGTAESASFNPDYPAILGKHLMAGAVESGIPIRDLTQYFGQRAGALADTLMSQGQIHLNRDGLLWARGYPHKEIALRGHAAAAVKLLDSHTGEEFEEMSLDMAHRELFPGAIYSAQDGNGEVVKYRSTELNVNERRAILTPVDSKTTTFTIAETDLDVRLLEALAEPKTVALLGPNGELEPMPEGLELVLGWGQVTSSVTGYRSCVREYAQTCTSSGCRNYNRSLTGKLCSACGRRLQYAELTTVVDTVEFEKPYRTQYETPVVKVTARETAGASVEQRVQQLKAEVLKKHDGNVPPGYAALWEASATSVAMHSIGHQIIFAVPLVVLSSSLDLNYLVEEEGGTVGYFYDSCADGNGSSEAIFHQFLRFAEAAASLARACSCEAGCPKCLYQHSCPQANEALNKQVGLTLLEAVSAANKATATD